MREFDKIYLSWRKGQGFRRHIVGVLQERQDQSYVFNYDIEAIKIAREDGFTPYTEFSDITKSYNGSVLDVFAQRLTKNERPDIDEFYSFWEIDPKYKSDKFYLLGHTQGIQPTDNFEFLADYKIVSGLHFLTEIAGLSVSNISSEKLNVGDLLFFKIDPHNTYDSDAVKVLKGDLEVGYIKKIHCRIFHKPEAEKLKLSVKALEKNGKIKRVFVKVEL
jgi:hypothetical protein